MASQVSTVPAVKARLLELLAARPGLEGVQVEWSWPGDEQLRPEAIVLGKARGDEEAANLGQRKREEAYIQEVLVHVFKRGDHPQATDERAYELVGELEEALRPDPTLGLSGVLTAEVVGADLDSYRVQEGRCADVLVRVRVKARK